MSAATDKAQFYLEQQVPELRELEAKGIFDGAQIRAIVRRRRDFEHKLCAPGSTPADWDRYLDYETTLDEYRLLAAKRAGAKVSKHSGPRRLFPLMQRATRKFPGDVALWMTYVRYARRLKAYKRVRKALADMLRLHPDRADLWVYAARYEFEDQGDLNEAESYIQRGLRVNPTSKTLYAEFFRLLLDSLLKIEVKSRKLGLHRKKGEEELMLPGGDNTEASEDQIMLPSAEEMGFGVDGENNDIDPKVVAALEKTRGPHEQIARAIFQSAMKQFKGSGDLELASEMFDIATMYSIPGRIPLLKHIYETMRDRDSTSAWCRDAALRMPLVDVNTNTADFALGLAKVLPEMNQMLREDTPSSRRLHILSARWIHRYLQVEGLDEAIAMALKATLMQVVDSYRKVVEDPDLAAWKENIPRPYDESVELLQLSQDAGNPKMLALLREAAVKRWPTRMPATEVTVVKAT